MTRHRLHMVLTAALTFAVLITIAPVASAFVPPTGWRAGARVVSSPEPEAPGEPACCALGGRHPCCVHERRFQRSTPNQIGSLALVDVEALPVVNVDGCDDVPKDAPLPPAEIDASSVGLGIYAEDGPGPLITKKLDTSIRLRPSGKVGGIRGANVGLWRGGASGTFSDKHFSQDYGIQYQIGARWGRLGRLTFDSIHDDDDGALSFRLFDGSFDAVTGRVGQRCAYQAPLTPVLEGWVYAFVGERNGKRELHVVMPDGRHLLSRRLEMRTAFDPLYAHHILPLDTDGVVATQTRTFEWEHVVSDLDDPFYVGVISVHVSPAGVIVAQERSRS